jgi:CheY-like chemotaxis protein
VAAALRARPETAHVPVVVLTAKELNADERARLHGQISALVRKGGSTGLDLVTAIRELETRHGREAARAS